MRKQELIHLHGLLAQVQKHYEKQTGEEVNHDLYNSLDVLPTSIHRSKTDHKAAVFTLANDIVSEMGEKKSEELDFNPQEDYQRILDEAEQYGELKEENDLGSKYRVPTGEISLNETELQILDNSEYPVEVQNATYQTNPDYVIISDENIDEILE